jgi:MerR family transcriptional regulator, mercuric resistance operon regulatory protein
VDQPVACSETAERGGDEVRLVGDVRTLLRLGGPEKASCREVRKIASTHLDDIRTKIADLRKLERLLTKTVAQCTGTTAPECPVLDILDIRHAK